MNAGHLLLNPNETAWCYGKLVGIKFEPANAQTQNQDLALVYAYLRIPISLPTGWKVPDEYSLQDAQKALPDDIHCPMTPRAKFPALSELPEDHYDYLVFSVVRPHYPEHHYNADGSRTTKSQHQWMVEDESSDMAKDNGSADSEDYDANPGATIDKVMEDVQSTDAPAASSKPSAMHRSPILQLNTSTGTTSLVPTSSLALMAASPQTSTNPSLSPTSPFPPSASGSATTMSRDQKRNQRAKEHLASLRVEWPHARKKAWGAYFRDQQAHSVSYEESDSSHST